MRTVLKYVSIAALLAFACVSCGRKGKVIPRGEMAEIYAEMFVLDQRIASESDIRRMADTMLVYEPVFREHGYTSDDYRRSMAYYIKDPDRYVRILKETVEILETRRKELKSEKSRIESMSQSKARSEIFRPERIYFLSSLADRDLLTVDSLTFYIDSTGAGSYDFDVQKGYDTLYSGPRLVIRADTLAVTPPDSVSVSPEPAEGEVLRIAGPAGDQLQPVRKMSVESMKLEL